MGNGVGGWTGWLPGAAQEMEPKGLLVLDGIEFLHLGKHEQIGGGCSLLGSFSKSGVVGVVGELIEVIKTTERGLEGLETVLDAHCDR